MLLLNIILSSHYLVPRFIIHSNISQEQEGWWAAVRVRRDIRAISSTKATPGVRVGVGMCACVYMANYFYYWTKNTAVLKIYMGFDGRDTPILTFSKSKKYLKIFSPSFNIAIKQNIISWDIYRSVSPMQKHVNCGAFGSVDKITCHMCLCEETVKSAERRCLTFHSSTIETNERKRCTYY